MASETEPAKLLLPYLQRADELQKHEPLVAYYCRLYAMERGLKIPQNERTKTTNSLLVSLMKQLEKDKKSLKLGPEDNLYLEGFALNVFAKADKQDRAGRADLNTAKTFYAASIFFEILNQFGALQPDLEQKQKYAAWKAADIRKAMKEGRKPVPGPPGGGEDLSIPPSTPSGSYDIGTSETPNKGPGSDSDPSSEFPDRLDRYSANVSPPPQLHDKVSNQHSADIPPLPPSHDFHPTSLNRSDGSSSHDFHPSSLNRSDGSSSHDFHPSSLNRSDSSSSHDFHPSSLNRSDSSSYSQPSAGYPTHDFHPPPSANPPPPANRSENSTYSQPYHHQYSQEPQQHLPHNYPSQENPTYNYPNFQSYPSFTESSLPSIPAHYTSYYQGSEIPYSPHSAAPAPTTSYQSTSEYSSSSRNGTISEPPPAQKYQYDSNYQPPPEKISEAHKAARFAVGALAFDDVSIAVDYLKKSLELLTNPSAGQ